MGIMSGLSSNPLTLGIIAIMSLVALGAKELVMTKDPILHKKMIKYLNVSIIMIVIIFLYVFSRIVIKTLSV